MRKNLNTPFKIKTKAFKKKIPKNRITFEKNCGYCDI